jgi:hypothetical protein
MTTYKERRSSGFLLTKLAVDVSDIRSGNRHSNNPSSRKDYVKTRDGPCEMPRHAQGERDEPHVHDEARRNMMNSRKLPE